MRGNRLRAWLARVRRRLLPDGTPRQQRYHALRVRFDRWYLGPPDARLPPAQFKGSDDALSVVVLAMDAQPELVDAVRSLARQRPTPEIILVNSGRGGAAERLQRAGLEATVIECNRRLMPGAARNVGIAAAHHPIVAFLAADCVAEAGWVAARLQSHARGADLVGSPVVNAYPWNPFAEAAHMLLFATRLPGTLPRQRAFYGASYRRALFSRFGHFDPDLRTGEDTEFHARLPSTVAKAYDPRVRTAHRNPRTLPALLKEQFLRGRRRALASMRIGIAMTQSKISEIGRVRVRKLTAMALSATPGRDWPRLLWAWPWTLPANLAYVRGMRSAAVTQLAAGSIASAPQSNPGRRRLYALLQLHDDAAYLPGYLDNVRAQVDGILILDDGSTEDVASLIEHHPGVIEILRLAPRVPHTWDERRNQRVLIDAARRHRADWVIAVDADERLERDFRVRAEPLLERADREGIHTCSIVLRELWDTPHQYRCDGVWGRKRRARLFKPSDDHVQGDTELHSSWAPLNHSSGCKACHMQADLIIYHLAMIHPEQREQRKAKYKRLDPENRFQRVNYDYLTDETGIQFAPVPVGREYFTAATSIPEHPTGARSGAGDRP